MSLQSLCQQLEDLKIAVLNETAKKLEVQKSAAFLDLAAKIAALAAEQAILLADLPDSSVEYSLIKDQVINEMRASGVTGFGNVQAKFKEKKEVNRDKLLRVLEGDLDVYIALSNVTQVALKDHAKGNSKEHELMDCIEVLLREIVDVSVAL